MIQKIYQNIVKTNKRFRIVPNLFETCFFIKHLLKIELKQLQKYI